MKLKLERGTAKTIDEVTVTSDTSDYLMFICLGLTQREHISVKNELENDLDIEATADVYFVRNLLSVYIFDVETLPSLDNCFIKYLIPEVDHKSIYKGAILGNNKLGNLAITIYKGELRIGTKFNTLLTMHKE